MWTPAKLGGLGDAALESSCVPAPYSEGNYSNPNRVICGGMYFAERPFALSWPGAGQTESMPTVQNTLAGGQIAPPDQYGDRPAATPTSGGKAGPITLVSPLPSITPASPVNPGLQTGPDGAGGTDGVGAVCWMSNWATHNPLFAVGLAGLVYVVLKGRKGKG